MEEDLVVGRTRKRARPTQLRCYIVDDHCDALSKIHIAIRRGSLPFTGLSALHFDAHPDLMVTPDMPAETCFIPRALYDTLAEAEGGIAEWILPLVYQGHLSEMWWIRPEWAKQFTDGNHRFSVGQVKATGKLRVSSTAPYFVDDRLFCPEEGMKECKPLNLFVSLLPEDLPSPTETQAAARISGKSRLFPSAAKDMRSGSAEHVLTSTDDIVTPRSEVFNGDDTQPTPWVLDICLDYFTTENPFMAELECHIGKEDATLVRDFYEKPRFRGAATSLPHAEQIEHERVFRTEVDRLLRLGGAVEEAVDDGGSLQPSPGPTGDDEGVKRTGRGLATLTSTSDDDDGSPDHSPDAESKGRPGEVIGRNDCMVASAVSEEAGKKGLNDDEECPTGEGCRQLRRLEELFGSDGEDRFLPQRFASTIRRMGRKGRELVAWADHCSCLPRYLATREEVKLSVRRVEAFLQALLLGGGDGTVGSTSTTNASWRGPPGVITVARSAGDGYVPKDVVEFVEREVLAMLFRLYGGGDGHENVEVDDVAGGSGGRLGVFYEDGLQPAQD
ncbi:unnamed protein product [Hapterophycus canaliculatus]